MHFNRIIIIIFVTSLFSSNMLWAAGGQLDNLFDSLTESTLDNDNDNDVLHHIKDGHHDGHDCHMSAHLVGLNSQILTITTDFYSVQELPVFELRFSTRDLPPPSKPPRT